MLRCIDVTGETNLITFCPAEDRTRDTPHLKQRLYHVRRYNSRLVHYLTLVHIPPPILDSSANLKLSNHSIPGHQAHQGWIQKGLSGVARTPLLVRIISFSLGVWGKFRNFIGFCFQFFKTPPPPFPKSCIQS